MTYGHVSRCVSVDVDYEDAEYIELTTACWSKRHANNDDDTKKCHDSWCMYLAAILINVAQRRPACRS